MNTKPIRLYTASKISDAPLWLNLAKQWSDIKFISRWLTEHVGKTPDSECYAKIFWQHDHQDIALCDVLILYTDSDKHLRGGLVEAGMALALNKPVVVLGDHPDYGTWQHHPGVYKVKTFDEAKLLLNCFAVGLPNT